MRFRILSRVAVVLLIGWALPSFVQAEKSAAQLMPASVAGYFEIARPSELMAGVLDHPLTHSLEQRPEYQKYLESPQYQDYLKIVAAIEAKLGMKLRHAAEKLSAEGIYVGGDLATQGGVLLIHSSDPKCTEKARDAIVEMVGAETSRRGQPNLVKVDDHRGIALYQIDQVRFAAHDGWLIAATKPVLMRAVLNNCLDDDNPSLAAETQFKAAYEMRPPHATAWAYADLRLVRASGLLKAALTKKSDNPVIELLAGGIVGALPDAPYVTSTFVAEPTRLAISFSMPSDVPAVAKQREFYFGVAGKGQAPPLLETKQTILSLSTYRDFGSLWQHAPDLFNEEINAKFAEAETGLSTLFAGRNFRDEILGNLEPGLQLVVARQEYKDVTPALKFPAGAIVVRLKNPAETAKIFKITFQSAIGFINVVGGMNGLDPLDVNSERTGDLLVVAAEYLAPKDAAAKKAAPPHFNVSPTAVFTGDKLILSSAKDLALELVDLVRKPPAADKDVNTLIKADLVSLGAILADNNEPLIAQNMLQKGHDRAAAEAEVSGLLDLLKNIEATTLRLAADEKLINLTWEVRLK